MARTLVIMGYGRKLSVENGMFKVSGGGNGSSPRIPPSDVDEILITSPGVSVTSRALLLAGRAGIPVYIVVGRGDMPLVFSPVFGTKTVEARRAQYRAVEGGLGLRVARCLVSAKILNQAHAIRLLSQYREEREAWRRLVERLRDKAGEAEAVEGGEDWRNRLRHVEAEAARVYWSGLSLLLRERVEFPGRDPGAGDVVNTSLNYLYAILYSKAYYRLLVSGLDPYGGIFHVDKSGRRSLVYDFTEPFKPLLDHRLAQALLQGRVPRVEGGMLDDESRKMLVTLFHDAMAMRVRTGDGVPRSLEEALGVLAFKLSRMFLGTMSCESFRMTW